jgi:hypothetical protein
MPAAKDYTHKQLASMVTQRVAGLANGYDKLKGLDVNQTPLRPVIGRAVFTSAAGSIAAGTQAQAFTQKLGDPQGGQVVTNADATFFDEQTPTGQLIGLEGMGFALDMPVGATETDAYEIMLSTSILMNLRGREIRCGNLRMWPTTIGTVGRPNNGRTGLGVRRFQLPIFLEPQDQFAFTFTAERAIPTSLAADDYFIRAYLPATRFLDVRVLGLS